MSSYHKNEEFDPHIVLRTDEQFFSTNTMFSNALHFIYNFYLQNTKNVYSTKLLF